MTKCQSRVRQGDPLVPNVFLVISRHTAFCLAIRVLDLDPKDFQTEIFGVNMKGQPVTVSVSGIKKRSTQGKPCEWESFVQDETGAFSSLERRFVTGCHDRVSRIWEYSRGFYLSTARALYKKRRSVTHYPAVYVQLFSLSPEVRAPCTS